MKRLCPFEGYLSSAFRGTPFQLEFAGELLPFAQGRPQLAPSFRLPPRHGAYRPAELGEINAATRRFITYLPDIRVHDLRHSHVSLCIELGYSIVLVAKRIGDTVPVVMRTYAHLYPNKQQELVSRLETLSTSSSSKDESDLMPLV